MSTSACCLALRVDRFSKIALHLIKLSGANSLSLLAGMLSVDCQAGTVLRILDEKPGRLHEEIINYQHPVPEDPIEFARIILEASRLSEVSIIGTAELLLAMVKPEVTQSTAGCFWGTYASFHYNDIAKARRIVRIEDLNSETAGDSEEVVLIDFPQPVDEVGEKPSE